MNVRWKLRLRKDASLGKFVRSIGPFELWFGFTTSLLENCIYRYKWEINGINPPSFFHQGKSAQKNGNDSKYYQNSYIIVLNK